MAVCRCFGHAARPPTPPPRRPRSPERDNRQPNDRPVTAIDDRCQVDTSRRDRKRDASCRWPTVRSAASARETQPWTRGRWPCGRCRTCHPFTFRIRCIFLRFTASRGSRRTRAVIMRSPCRRLRLDDAADRRSTQIGDRVLGCTARRRRAVVERRPRHAEPPAELRDRHRLPLRHASGPAPSEGFLGFPGQGVQFFRASSSRTSSPTFARSSRTSRSWTACSSSLRAFRPRSPRLHERVHPRSQPRTA